jgi:sugar fermentation stimulation protein A
VEFSEPLIPATLLKRYRRFLADVRLDDGTELTVHVPNTGSLLGCAEPGLRVWLSDSGNPERKYRYTWERVDVMGARVGINTHRANALVGEALQAGLIPELAGYGQRTAEVRFGHENSRIDWLLQQPGKPDCYLEVKNVTAAVQDGIALFPDAVSARGTKHLRELMRVVEAGGRGVLLFCVQRTDAQEVRPADAIDAKYGQTLREARAAGVEVLAWRSVMDHRSQRLVQAIPVVCPPL